MRRGRRINTAQDGNVKNAEYKYLSSAGEEHVQGSNKWATRTNILLYTIKFQFDTPDHLSSSPPLPPGHLPHARVPPPHHPPHTPQSSYPLPALSFPSLLLSLLWFTLSSSILSLIFKTIAHLSSFYLSFVYFPAKLLLTFLLLFLSSFSFPATCPLPSLLSLSIAHH